MDEEGGFRERYSEVHTKFTYGSLTLVVGW